MPHRDRKRWTVLIYMVADDPQGGELLDQQAVREMDEITKAAMSEETRKHLNVALQVDFRTLPGVWRRVIGETTFVRPEGNAADPATLYGFFEWAARECPADHYVLIFWGHSRGQFGMFGDSDPFDYTAQTLTLDELGEALKAAKRSLEKPVDIIAFKDCFMATLETAYELGGLADYLLASPSLVPVEGWPYDDMFAALARDDGGPRVEAEQLLDALEQHYAKRPVPPGEVLKEVPYSLLSTRGAIAAVKKLGALVGEKRTDASQMDEVVLRERLDKAVAAEGDPALVDLGALRPTASVGRKQQAATNVFNDFLETLGNVKRLPAGKRPKVSKPKVGEDEPLVISHTGREIGGASLFLYPSSPKGQRDSLLTRLADEKAYRRLAISTDTRWADIALQSMPLPPARAQSDASAAIAAFEQLQRVGLGMAPSSAATANVYLRGLLSRSKSGSLTDLDLAQAAEYSAIAELSARLAAFAAKKGGDGFVKGGDGFVKGGDGFVDKGGDGGKGGDGFVSRR